MELGVCREMNVMQHWIPNQHLREMEIEMMDNLGKWVNIPQPKKDVVHEYEQAHSHRTLHIIEVPQRRFRLVEQPCSRHLCHRYTSNQRLATHDLPMILCWQLILKQLPLQHSQMLGSPRASPRCSGCQEIGHRVNVRKNRYIWSK